MATGDVELHITGDATSLTGALEQVSQQLMYPDATGWLLSQCPIPECGRDAEEGPCINCEREATGDLDETDTL